MVKKEDVDLVVDAIKAIPGREGLALCCIMVDTTDGSMAIFGPPGVNTKNVVAMAMQHYGLGTTAPAAPPEPKPTEPSPPPESGTC